MAGIVGVFESLHGFVEFLRLVQIAVGGSDQAIYCIMDGFGRIGEVIHVF